MAHFHRFETVDLPLKLSKEGVLQGYTQVVVSIAQKMTQINKFTDDLGIDEENDIINLSLSQEESGSFIPGQAYIQVNIKYEDERETSCQATIEVKDNLYQEVM